MTDSAPYGLCEKCMKNLWIGAAVQAIPAGCAIVSHGDAWSLHADGGEEIARGATIEEMLADDFPGGDASVASRVGGEEAGN